MRPEYRQFFSFQDKGGVFNVHMNQTQTLRKVEMTMHRFNFIVVPAIFTAQEFIVVRGRVAEEG